MKNAWIDSTGLLIGWGYMRHTEADGSDSYQHVEVPHDFRLEPLRWRYDGAAWIEHKDAPAKPIGALQKCLTFARRIFHR